MVFPTVSFAAIWPQVIVAVTAVIVLMSGLYVAEERRYILGYLGIVGLVVAFVVDLAQWNHPVTSMNQTFSGMVVQDNFSIFANAILLLVGAATMLLSMDYLVRENMNLDEYYGLVLACLAGMMLMVSSTSLMTVFLSLELFSICLYVLAAFNRVRRRSQEAGLKYFLLSSFASAFLLYGMALIYGATGSTLLSTIGSVLTKAQVPDNAILFAGMGLLAVGLAFKMSAVPFHVWTPDVYEGSPGTIAAFMSVGTKLAAFAAFMRVFASAMPALHAHWQAAVWALAVLTMIVGNVAAVVQTNIKRMLAYSGIAHAGYILIAVAVAQQGVPSILFYFLAYTFMNIGSFAVVIAASRRNEEQGATLADFAGMGARQPWLAAAMTIFMFSLAGFPPSAGFLAKFYVFQAAVTNGHAELAVIGVLCSLISVFYYLRVVFVMYMRPGERAVPATALPRAFVVVLAISVVGSIVLGIQPGAPLDWAQHSTLLSALQPR